MTKERVDLKFISIHVRNPRIHLLHGRPVYTDYEILVQTNSTIFAKERSQVRRRFSEFAWLWKQLSRYNSFTLELPSLPTKTKIFGRYSKDFIEKRRVSLQEALASLARITPVLADSLFHLFIQSHLDVKEMVEFINGQDQQNLGKVISPRDNSEPRYGGNKGRRCTCQSTGDSGFSSSAHPEDADGSTRLFDDVSNWVASQRYYASTLMTGNGWSSGYPCQTGKILGTNYYLPSCPECSNERSTTDERRRVSLSLNVASVLPGGKLMVSPTERTSDGEQTGQSSEDSKHYEGDDEAADIDLSEFDIIIEEPFVRVREWLNWPNNLEQHAQDSKDEEENTIRNEPFGDIRMKDYDIISVPCSLKPTHSVHSKSTGCHSEHKEGDEEEEEEEGSEFSFVHSSIIGIDWKDRDELSSSCDSLHSAALYLTYDVVEMIELRYNNVV
ncbi:PREDICTED: uncharacterized protein LOC107332020 isoform X4 [Acropora digitifera]|uniref:uncharacterized protein LOC107332020 isoform X4 n=1 Tax=Acropora digitifera TaxID=70779 RepID=UPI00077A4EFF|nr:PREDICTED: uncharacterized protein LOC107332020 isoform X4 [Acropora digitifera]